MGRNNPARGRRRIWLHFVISATLFATFSAAWAPAARAHAAPPAARQAAASKTSAASLTPDAYEVDNDWQHASVIAPDSPQNHSIHEINSLTTTADQDWVTFTLESPASITLETSGPVPMPGSDTVISLYDSNQILLQMNDDKNAFTWYSYIQRCNARALPAGTYYLGVHEFGGDNLISSYDITYHIMAPGETCHLFADMPLPGQEWMESWVDAFYHHGISTGCGSDPLIYCPYDAVTRAEMAVFLLRARHGGAYQPPASTGIFLDVPVPGKEWMQPWIEQFYREGLTSGCGAGPIFCPENNVTRAEMAVFVLRGTHAPGWQPPASTGIFADVPIPGKEWMQPWIEEYYREQITSGCAGDPLRYCPESATTRAEMAVFINRAFHLYP